MSAPYLVTLFEAVVIRRVEDHVDGLRLQDAHRHSIREAAKDVLKPLPSELRPVLQSIAKSGASGLAVGETANMAGCCMHCGEHACA